MGGLVGFWINFGVSTTMESNRSQWLVPFGVQLIPCGMLFIGLFFIPESPRWLLSKGKREKALEILCWVRQLERDDPYMQEELGAIDEDLERYHREVGTGFWKPFKALKDRKLQYRFWVGAMLFLFQNGTSNPPTTPSLNSTSHQKANMPS